jgi:hypothetical protein
MFSLRPMISRNVADWVRRSHGSALWLVARMVERPLAYPSLCIRQPDLIVASYPSSTPCRGCLLHFTCLLVLVWGLSHPLSPAWSQGVSWPSSRPALVALFSSLRLALEMITAVPVWGRGKQKSATVEENVK